MIWNGDKEFGCLGNEHNLFACRFKALDYASCNTPNYGGAESFKQNVYERKHSFESCVAKVEACGLPVPEPKSADALDEVTGLSASAPGAAISSSPLASFVPVAAAVLMVGALLGMMAMRRARADQRGVEMDAIALVEESTE